MGELFDKVQSLQSLMLGEVTGFYSVVFYTCSALISHFVTSTKRTAEARLWLLIIVTLNVVCERIIVSIGVPDTIYTNGNIVDGNVSFILKYNGT